LHVVVIMRQLVILVLSFVLFPLAASAQFTSGSPSSVSTTGSYRNLKTYYGAVGDGVADDTVPLNNAATDYNAGISIYMPKGAYRTTTGLSLATIKGNIWAGEGSQASTIRPVGAGVVGITLSGATFIGQFQDFGIDSNGVTTTGAGISSPSGTQVLTSTWKNLFISVGGNGIEVFNHFSHTLDNVQANSSTGYCFVLAGANTVFLNRTYAQTCGTPYKAGYRIRSAATMMSVNGVDNADYWGVFGSHASITGTAQAGSTSTTIKLAAGISIDGGPATTDVFKGRQISLTGGTGSGQTNTITAFNKATVVATVLNTWATTPDVTTTYSIQDDISQFRNSGSADINISGSNVEAFNIGGIRLVSQAQRLTLRDTIFKTKATGTYDASIHILDQYEPGADVLSFSQLQFQRNGATRNFGQEIAVDFIPAYMSAENIEDQTTGAVTQFYDVDAATSRPFPHIHPTTWNFTSLTPGNGSIVATTAVPTISSGFGTGASVSLNNGTWSFRINVGTGGTATSGVIGLPAATNGWNCKADDITTLSTTVFETRQTGSSTTTATLGNFSTAGTAGAWVANDILAVQCAGL
jgi:hypothetical protein